MYIRDSRESTYCWLSHLLYVLVCVSHHVRLCASAVLACSVVIFCVFWPASITLLNVTLFNYIIVVVLQGIRPYISTGSSMQLIVWHRLMSVTYLHRQTFTHSCHSVPLAKANSLSLLLSLAQDIAYGLMIWDTIWFCDLMLGWNIMMHRDPWDTSCYSVEEAMLFP